MSTTALMLKLAIAHLRRAQAMYDLKGVHHYLTLVRQLAAGIISGTA